MDKHSAIIEKLIKSDFLGIFFLKKSRYRSAKNPATADLPKVINSADSSLLLDPKAILVATGVSENINMPTNP